MERIIKHKDLFNFSREVLTASGCEAGEARTVTEILVWCDLIGRYIQGAWRLPILTKRLEQHLYESPCHYQLERKADSLCIIDASRGIGHYVAAKAMEEAISMARQTGIAFVGVKNSNFFGAGAYYVQQAAKAGMVGIAASNSFPKVAAYNGVSAVLGTNPFAFSAPRRNGRSLLLDMATSASAGSCIRKAIEKGEELADGIAVDAEGNYIRDPVLAEKGTILPFGGAKGYGLSLMVDILSGIITGAGFSHGVKSMYKNFEDSGNNGHFFIAIDIKQLIPLEYYYERLEIFVDYLKESGKKSDDNESSVILPGEIRWDNYEHYQAEGIPMCELTIEALMQLADKYKLPLSQYLH